MNISDNMDSNDNSDPWTVMESTRQLLLVFCFSIYIMCDSQRTFLNQEFDELPDSDLGSAQRFEYKEVPDENSGELTIEERGWKFVFPTNQ